MKELNISEEFSLLGGPLHRTGRRLGLVRGANNTVALGLALGLIPWIVMMALARNSISVVRNMRFVPISLFLLKDYLLTALLPFLPLLLFKHPVADLAEKFFTRLTGL